MKEAATYVLSGALPVNDDADDEQLARVSRHLSGIATVYLKRDEMAQTVSLRISGTLTREDARYIEQRIERFAEEYTTAAAVLLREWDGLTRWLVVGMNWQAQCLIKLGAVQEQYTKLAERHLDFVLQLEPSDSPLRRTPLMCISVEADSERMIP
jgi:hypothetical protein